MKLLLLICLLSLSQFSQADDDLTIESRQNPGASIPVFRVVTKGISRGGRPSPVALRSLAHAGYRTILSLQGGDHLPGLSSVILAREPGEAPAAIAAEKSVVQSLGMQFVNIPLNSLEPVTAIEDQQIRQVIQVLENPATQPVFVHCEHGKDRTGLIIAIERVRLGWTPAAAHAEWVALGHTGHLTNLFTGWLDRYFEALTGFRASRKVH